MNTNHVSCIIGTCNYVEKSSVVQVHTIGRVSVPKAERLSGYSQVSLDMAGS